MQEIANERARQDQKWGGPEHDDDHNTFDFIVFIQAYLIKAEFSTSTEEGRRRLIQVAALAVAAVESIDRFENL